MNTSELERWRAEFGDIEITCKKCKCTTTARTAINWPEPRVCDECDHSANDGLSEEIYTDGCCIGNRPGGDNPAGWAIVVVDTTDDEIIKEEKGMVVTDPKSALFHGAEKRTNNTAELTAILYALLYVDNCLSENDSVTIRYDSEYAAKSVTGEFNGTKNKKLIRKCREVLKRVKCKVSFVHVKGHSGNKYNDLADKLAKEGADECTKYFNKKRKSSGDEHQNKRVKR
jgi:ribonuclease HI